MLKTRFFCLLTPLCLVGTFAPVLLPVPAQAQLFNSALDQLPVAERVSLRNGETIVSGQAGQYTGKVLVTASPELVRAVLTDYNNFAKFLPNVVASQIIETKADRKVVEQVSVHQVFLTTVRSRNRLAYTPASSTRIDFALVEGDNLQKLQGYWQIEPIAAYKGGPVTQVLITQNVETQPTAGTPKGIFYSIFKKTLGETLQGFSQEIGRRVKQGATPGALKS